MKVDLIVRIVFNQRDFAKTIIKSNATIHCDTIFLIQTTSLEGFCQTELDMGCSKWL